jgi:hypothetical protein
MSDLTSCSLAISLEKGFLTLHVPCLAALCSDLRIKVAISAETSAEGDVDVYHDII